MAAAARGLISPSIPASGTLHVPVGNAFPDFVGTGRAGANLFTAGIVALDAATGRLKWWYQTQPHDVHDWDATGSAVFTPAGGKAMVAATAKDGYVHLLDAATGKLQSRTSVTTHKNDQAPLTTAGTHFCPGPAGGMEWNGAAFSSGTGLVYVNSVDWCVTVKLTAVGANAPKMSISSFGGGIPVPDSMSLAHGWTTAIDPKTGSDPLEGAPAHADACGRHADSGRCALHRHPGRPLPCAGCRRRQDAL